MKAQRIETSRKKLFEGNKDLIRKFLQIAERKVSVIDEYGDENWETLPDEINTCLVKIAKREGVHSNLVKLFQKQGNAFVLGGEEYEWLQGTLDKVYRAYHQAQKEKPASNVELENMSGPGYLNSSKKMVLPMFVGLLRQATKGLI